MNFKLILLATLVKFCASEEFFTVTGSQLLKLNKPYKASINFQGYENETVLEVSILNGQQVEDFKRVKLFGEGAEVIDLKPNNRHSKNSKSADYKLKVKSISGSNFESSRELQINKKEYAVFIQTDKSLYKPSDKINFGVLLLDESTRPYQAGNVQIYVTDGSDNRLKQFDNPKFKKGVHLNELKLSDSPVLGSWKIHVKVNNDKEITKEFEVAEYTLPKFEFSIDANPDSNYKEGKISATVRAKYTFGKIAKGNATITVRGGNKIVSRTVEVNGKKNVEFTHEELGIQKSLREKTVKIFATFTEELSGKDQNATAEVQIHVTPHKIKFTKSGEKFKPGLPFKVTSLVNYHDKNAPVTDKSNPLKFTTKVYTLIEKKCKRMKSRWNYGSRTFDSEWGTYQSPQNFEKRVLRSTSDYEDTSSKEDEMEEYDCPQQSSYEDVQEIFVKNGKAEVNLEVPSNATKIDVEGRYFDTVESVKDIKKAESESKQYIQAKLLTEKPSIMNSLKIEITATHSIQKLNYQIFTNGGNIISKTFDAAGAKQFEITIQPRHSMAPKSTIIFFYLTSNGEIVSDKVSLEFEKRLSNEIDIQLSSNQTKPGSDINIAVSTSPGSFVGLLGVDQSVLILKKGNEIAKGRVLKELEKFNKVEEKSQSGSYFDFKKSNVLIITNAKEEYLGKSKPAHKRPYYRFGGSQMRTGFGSVTPYSLTPYSFSASASARPASAQSFQPFQAFQPTSAFDAPIIRTMAIKDYEDRSFNYRGDIARNNEHTKPVKKPIEVRKEFPETWFFEGFEMSANESNTKILTKKVPDTITSWIITGFSVDPEKGLGITKEASKLNVFQPFFVTTNLPYSIKRGEVSAVPIVVFNYLETDQEVDVILFNADQEFEFLDPTEEENSVTRRRRSIEQFQKKRVLVKSNEGSALTFMIRALKVGSITIKVTAESQVAGDGLERKLLVEPEGIPKFKNEAVMIDLKNSSSFTKNITISVPNEAVPDSTKVEAAVTGDILGPSIENLDSLIKLPSGCGEQNMLNFVPNILVLDYLTSVDKLTSEIDSKAKSFMETGYQKELTYKHDDGSYSAFGKSDNSGSTWLTAYVAKSFNEASKYIQIDQKIIDIALRWLSRKQNRDGSFSEVGYMLSKSMQGGAAGGTSLTAYTLITFLENKKHSGEYEDTINRSLDYIESTMFDLNDTYAMAVTAYALQLANHAQKDVFLDKLDVKVENVNGMKYWKRNDESSSNSRPNSINIETTAYALLAFVEAERDSDALSIMKWLVTQRNEKGGFHSTQDTIVGLQALAKISSKMYSSQQDIMIYIETPSASPVAMTINSENSLILQKQDLPSEAREFKIYAGGKGVGVLQISYKYNMPLANKARFQLTPKVLEASNKEFLHLSVCTSFIEDLLANSSNMAVMEVTLPSGFTFDFEHKLELLTTEKVKRVETKEGDTIVIVYFDDIITREICPEFKAYRTHGVAKQKPAPVVIYDYYDNSRRTEAFYNAPEISLCDICGDDVVCADVCESDGIEIAR